MASSAAQIHGLGVGIGSTSSRKPTFSFAPRSVFFGQNLRKTTATFLKHTNNTSRRRYSTGPVRIVNEKVVGIDLGTTNSAVAAMEGGKPTIVTNAEGQRTTPSVVAYTKNGDRLVGQIAKRQAVVNPENTFFSVKRFIGRKMSEVDEESKQVSYKVVRDENGNVKLECPAIGKQFAAEEISAQENRKRALNLHYIYAVLEVGDGVFEVLSTSGDTHLGGDDFDKRVVDWLAGSFKRDEGIDLLKDKQALQRLTETAEKAKMELSSLTQTNISLPFITATADGPKHIETTLTRAKFEELCSDLLDSDEVERMVSEAEKFAKEDKEKRDAIDTKNQADSVVYQTEKQLKELGEKVPAPVKEKVEAKLQELKDAVAGGSTQGMKDAMAALNQEVMQLGQSLYNQPGAAPGAGPAPGSEAGPSDSSNKGPDGDVIDADFTDSK
ncbi:hypothetical protein H0E87_007784 [Populus deltoides]|uniref:Uncharacterized protein n=1 Tax=Populus deltoides TaxID=3696 RepID=A0A8T2YY81_POPDE|nr:hypothetical protein H0E87_007784 [Populus deltoides]